MELNRAPAPEADATAQPPARRAWFHRESISLAEIFVQTFAVVLGILLALGLDDWKKQRETDHNIGEAMTALRGELESNQAQMLRQARHLREVANAMLALEKSYHDADKRCGEYNGWTGLGIPTFVDAAYQTAIATQTFSHIDFHRGEDIAAAYAVQTQYKNFYDKLLDFLLRMQPTPPSMCGGLTTELADFAEASDRTFVKARAAAQH